MVKIHKIIGAKNPEQDAKDVLALEQAISKVISRELKSGWPLFGYVW